MSFPPQGAGQAAEATDSIPIFDNFMANSLDTALWDVVATNSAAVSIDTSAGQLHGSTGTTTDSKAEINTDVQMGADGEGGAVTEYVLEARMMFEADAWNAAEVLQWGFNGASAQAIISTIQGTQTEDTAVFITNDGTQQTSSEFTFTKGVYYDVKIVCNASGSTLYIDGSAVAENTTNPMPLNVDVKAGFVNFVNGTGTNDMDYYVDYVNLRVKH